MGPESPFDFHVVVDFEVAAAAVVARAAELELGQTDGLNRPAGGLIVAITYKAT